MQSHDTTALPSRVERVCPVCKKAFLVRRWTALNGGGIYCSFPCSRIGYRTTPETFWAQVQKQDNGCWLWTGPLGRRGYGKVMVNHTRWQAHRYAWTLHRGSIPAGLYVCHNCPGGDNPTCINPDHLFLGTDADNQRDSIAKGRRDHLRGQGNSQAKLTEEMVRAMRAMHRPGVYGYARVASTFGVSKRTAMLAITGRQWGHVT
jgi:hypothetical protein